MIAGPVTEFRFWHIMDVVLLSQRTPVTVPAVGSATIVALVFSNRQNAVTCSVSQRKNKLSLVVDWRA